MSIALPYEDVIDIQRSVDGRGTTMSFFAFNTSAQLLAYGAADAVETKLWQALDDCRAYERLFSRTLPSSDIGRLNAAGGDAVPIDPRTADVLMRALAYCEASEGAFDITVGPLVAAWDFKNRTVASPDALEEAVRHVGFRKLNVQPQCGGNWFARLSDDEAQVDLGGIAKGWIADMLGRALLGDGVEGALINLGGNLLARGQKPDGNPWRLGIRAPKTAEAEPRILLAIEVEEGALVTSGTYERAFERDGTLYHHILDPRTGLPVQSEWASVSVLADKAIDAEGFSTTLLALGLDRSRELAKGHPEIIQAFFVAPDGAIELLRL